MTLKGCVLHPKLQLQQLLLLLLLLLLLPSCTWQLQQAPDAANSHSSRLQVAPPCRSAAK
jgi:hypothetical protein